MDIILNKCWGGYGVSESAILKCRTLGADWAQYPKSVVAGESYSDGSGTIDHAYVADRDSSRVCPHLIALVRKDSHAASGSYASLKVVTIPDGMRWEIDDYDGQESIGEPRTMWG